MANTLWQTCRDAVGHRVRYSGTNGDEYSIGHGLFVRGEGVCVEQHDSHGLCICVRDDDGNKIWVDPIEVEVLYAASND